MAIIQRVGDPENESEGKAIHELAKALPADYVVAHNFELTAGRGMPYEYDVCVVGEHAVYHVEVKGYRGLIRGDRHQWTFENGAVYPSPIPLANKKTKIMAGMLRDHARFLEKVFVDTIVLLTDDRAKAQIRDEQAHRVVHLRDAPARLTDRSALPVSTEPIKALHDSICEVILGAKPSKKAKQIGLYDVIEKIAQGDARTVYLAEHRYIRMRPKTILKVYPVDVYAPKDRQETRIRRIFHDQEALRLLSGHPNIVQTGDFFAWEHDKFVLPTEYMESGRPLEVLLDKEEDRKITWAEKRKIIAGIAAGLRHAHQGGVVHRDVRPLNVVVAPGAQVKLVNFDLAKIGDANVLPPDLDDRLDPRYAAPEVWEDAAKATPASDVYSLGVLFYELIVGERPYGHVDQAVRAKSVSMDLDALRREFATPGCEDFMKHPDEAVDVIRRMCAFDPKERYASMDGVIEDLELIGDS